MTSHMKSKKFNEMKDSKLVNSCICTWHFQFLEFHHG